MTALDKLIVGILAVGALLTAPSLVREHHATPPTVEQVTGHR